MKTLYDIIGAIALGVGLGMILSQSVPPSFMPVMPSWLYLVIGIGLFTSGFTIVMIGLQALGGKG